MSILWRILTISCILLLGALQAQTSYESLLRRAAAADPSAFGNDYVAEKTAQWNRHFALGSFVVDTVCQGDTYTEIGLSSPSLSGASNYRLALLVRRNGDPRIIDVRRLLLRERNFPHPLDEEIVQFVERLAWIFDTGKTGFLHDMLFPSYIEASYRGLRDKGEIVRRLHSRFKKTLPIQSVNWEKSGREVHITVVIDNPLQPLELSIDFTKYLSAYFFELEDKRDRVNTLRDSLTVWLNNIYLAPKPVSTAQKAASPREAFDRLIATEFADYNTLILEESANSLRFEAVPLPIDQFTPASLVYRLLAQSDENGGRYHLQAIWEPNTRLYRYPISIVDDGETRETPEMLRDDKAVFFLNRMTHRYSSLGQSPLFQPETETGLEFRGNLVIHEQRSDSLTWNIAENYRHLLINLTRGGKSYFFPRGLIKAGSKFTITGYAFWPDQVRQWHHIAKVSETYTLVDYAHKLTGVTIHLFPYIRTENVRDIWGVMEESTASRKTIIISR